MRSVTVLSVAGGGHNRSRAGSFATEMIIAAIITGTTMAVLVPGLAAVGQQRQMQKFEAFARIELNNLEQAGAERSGGTWALSEWFRRRYPDAELTAEVVALDQPEAKLPGGVRLKISRRNGAGQVAQHVSLVVWPEVTGGTP